MNHPEILKSLRNQIKRNIPDGKNWNDEVKQLIENHDCVETIWSKFAVWLLVDPEDGVLQYAENEESRASIRRVAELYAKCGTKEEFRAAAAALAAAGWAAGWAAAAYWTALASSDAAAAYAAAVRKQAYEKQAAKLLELLKEGI